jgi:tetratricopeptide (TPR) repeat protein
MSPTPATPRRSPLWDAALVLQIALVIRLLYFLEYRRSPFFDFLHLDPLYYHDWALRIASGDWLGKEVFEQSPLYPYLLAIYFSLFGHGLTLLRLLQFLLGAVTATLTCVLGGRLFGRAAGLVAGIGAAAYAPFLFYEGQVMKEFLTPLFTVTVLHLFLRGIEEGAGKGARGSILLALSGAGIGMTALVRDNALLLIPLLAGYLIAARLRRGGIREAAWMLAGAAAILLPVAARNHHVSGDWVLTTSGGGEVFYIGNGPYATGAYSPPPWVRPDPRYEHEDFRRRAREIAGRDLSRAEASRLWYREGWRTVTEHLGAWPILLMRKAALFLNDHELADNYSFYSFRKFSRVLSILPTFGWVAMLAAPGLLGAASRWRELLPLYLVGGGYMASVILFFNFARFRLPFVIFLLLFAGEGAILLARSAGSFLAAAGRARSWRDLALYAGIAIAVLVATNVRFESGAGEVLQSDLNLAAAYRHAGRLPEAQGTLEATIREAENLVARHGWSPGSSTGPEAIAVIRALHDAHRNLAEILAAGSRSGEAIPQLLAAADMDPHDADLYERLAQSYRAQGDARAASTAYDRGLAANPDSFTLRLSRAASLYAAGDPSRARDDLIEARRLHPALDDRDLADWTYMMGIVLEALPAHRPEAAAYLRKALDLSPSHPQAGRARSLLQSMGG